LENAGRTEHYVVTDAPTGDILLGGEEAAGERQVWPAAELRVVDPARDVSRASRLSRAW
jgi:hypothetical protein